MILWVLSAVKDEIRLCIYESGRHQEVNSQKTRNEHQEGSVSRKWFKNKEVKICGEHL